MMPRSQPANQAPAPNQKSKGPSKFVGGNVCAACHKKEYERWTESHHDLAMQVANESTILGDFEDTSYTNFGVTSTFFKQDGKFMVRTDGPDGELHNYEIAYTFGVTPLQQYLINFPGGRYQALGIAWDNRSREEGGQRWFHLYPKEKIAHDDELHWTGLNQNWNYMCAECHSTNLQKNYSLEKNSYETTWKDIDIACEACHGPGSQHVAWAESTKQQDEKGQKNKKGLVIKFPLVKEKAWQFISGENTAKRTTQVATQTEIEVCARCHSRRTGITDAFKHGKPLLDTHLVSLLGRGLYHEDGQILDEVYVYGSFLQSKMYHAGVTCSDCHEPHSLNLRETGNVLCTRCHRSEQFDSSSHHFHKAGSAGTQCVECHMPSKTYMVVDPRRDHSFRVPRPDLSVKLNTPNACNQCHTKKPVRWAVDHVRNWYDPPDEDGPHYGEVLKKGHDRNPGAHAELAKLATEKSKPGIVRASALSLLEHYPTPQSQEAITQGLRDKDPLVRIGALRALNAIEPKKRYELASPLLKDPIRAVRIEAGRHLASVPNSLLSQAQQDTLNKTVNEYIEAQLVNAERPSAHMNLGILYSERGQFPQAEQEYRTSLRLNPSFYPALVNLADLYRMQKREEEGEGILRQALDIAPNDASVHHALGLQLVRVGKTQEAMSFLKKAMDIEAAHARYGYVYGIALHSAGDTEQAIAVLEKNHQRHPNDQPSLSTLITIHRDQGNQEAARRYADKLASLLSQ